MVKTNCKKCNKLFLTKPYRVAGGKGIYCSLKCAQFGKKQLPKTIKKRAEALKVVLKGKHCNPKTEFKKGHSFYKGGEKGWFKKGCISQRKNKKYIEISGNKHWNWKGGITPLHNKIRNSLEYKLWSDSVWNRDNNRCQKCSENRLEKLVAHHILNFAQFPELRFAIDNGITFCRKCHNWFHRVYGKKNNNLEQIYNFLMKKYDER